LRLHDREQLGAQTVTPRLGQDTGVDIGDVGVVAQAEIGTGLGDEAAFDAPQPDLVGGEGVTAHEFAAHRPWQRIEVGAEPEGTIDRPVEFDDLDQQLVDSRIGEGPGTDMRDLHRSPRALSSWWL
jgi:hypothetical protein